MKNQFKQALLGTTLVSLSLLSGAYAQGGGGRPGGQNQGNPNGQGGGRGGQNGQGRGQRITATLTQFGVTDVTTQGAIVTFATAQETARQSLRTQMQELSASLRDETIGDEQVGAQLLELRRMVEAEKTRRTAAEKVLDAQIGFTKDARLEAVLSVLGVIGDEAAFVGTTGGGRGGRGGDAGGPGGMNGGRGGGGGRGGDRGGGPPGGPGGEMDGPPEG